MSRSSALMAPAMTTERLPIVDCVSPEPRARGREHGEALRLPIREKIERWQSATAADYGEAPSSFFERLLKETGFRAAIERHTPELMEEVLGIAEGAGIDPETAYAMQLMDEEWWFGRAAHDGHCSGAAIAPSGRDVTAMGQTMDLPAWHDGAQALLKLRGKNGTPSLVFTSAGMIGLMGFSGRGLGICVNTLSGLRSRPDGLPVAFVMRGALARESATDAKRFLVGVPHASGQNYLIGDRRNVFALECSAAGAREVAAQDGRILHTNHPLVSQDLRTDAAASENSKARLSSLHAELGDPQGRTVENIKAALASRREGAAISMERRPDMGQTQLMSIGGVVYEIGGAIRGWVTGGPPSAGAWRELSFG